VQSNFTLGLPLLLLAILLGWLVIQKVALPESRLSLEILTLVLIWISAFVLCYGVKAFLSARFALLFLLLLVPIPDAVIDKVIFWLQAGSASVAFWLFRLLHVPALKDGFFLRLPALDLEVRKECSGIRSSLVLLVTVLLVGQFALGSFWSKSFLILSIIPIVIGKNAVRIVSIALLSMYVDRRFLHGWLHQSGGIVFYLLGLLALSPILFWLRRVELSRGLERTTRPVVTSAIGR
jgi:exosortase